MKKKYIKFSEDGTKAHLVSSESKDGELFYTDADNLTILKYGKLVNGELVINIAEELPYIEYNNHKYGIYQSTLIDIITELAIMDILKTDTGSIKLYQASKYTMIEPSELLEVLAILHTKLKTIRK